MNLNELSNEELVELYKTTKSEKYFNQLYKNCHAKTKRTAEKYYGFCGVHMSMDDMYQLSNIGMLKAIETFDDSKNVKFTTHLYNLSRLQIRNEIAQYSVVKRSKYKTHSYYNKINADDGDENFLDHIGYSDDILESDHNLLLDDLSKRLSAREFTIVKHIANGYSLAETAQMVGISRQHLNKIKKQIAVKIDINMLK